ncbi:MAG: hypothetical protein A2057_14755 [Ignavibacteria bacterium GWA2_35_9]|nr:MAG: hypothetical protein A2057_14755 [Ignavibacteria bacterium GWA2_35_9]OGU46795.1 MAG: hypothetical protein A2000_04810 [Ignavibacteria bacterium GWB2_36_8]OGU48060.1 MAG: hypothetical protein A2080_07655 [Ignavibacteria bacterium GWC2_36_12]OGU92700.1 MAG: hypothetical protein A2330_02645 [Ignavibacteria bacterium RIFOXYB2_FULL_36_7]OGU97811.1 MAG: hypothetical protein A3J84_01315 [Ignavibacteria bacterium RIFOXYA2_FULL_37_17]
MKELIIRLDPAIKIALLFFHFAGFSVWVGALSTNQVSITAIVVTIVSGFLLVVREIVKEDLIWFATVEGLFTIAKVLILITAFFISAKDQLILFILILLGILSAHLPKTIKDKKLFNNAKVIE